MSTVKLYGTSKSRALRSIWAIEETGIEYEHIPTSFAGDSKKPEYLAINPNGRVPSLVDGDLVLFESMAINLYLAKKYGGALYPTNPADVIGHATTGGTITPIACQQLQTSGFYAGAAAHTFLDLQHIDFAFDDAQYLF